MVFYRAPLKYFGSKYKLLGYLFNHFPKDINNFYDVFGGSGTVSWNIKNVKNTIYYNEKNNWLFTIIKTIFESDYKTFKTEWEQLEAELPLSFSEKNWEKKLKSLKYKDAYNEYKNKVLETENMEPCKKKWIRTLCLYEMSAFYNMGFDSFKNNILGKNKMNLTKIKIWYEYVKREKIKLINKDFREILLTDFKPNDFVYLDPPYLGNETKFYRNNNNNNNLEWNFPIDLELRFMLENLTKKNIKWTYSNTLTPTLEKWANKNNYVIHKLPLAQYSFAGNLKAKWEDKINSRNQNEILITNWETKPVSYRFEQLSLESF